MAGRSGKQTERPTPRVEDQMIDGDDDGNRDDPQKDEEPDQPARGALLDRHDAVVRAERAATLDVRLAKDDGPYLRVRAKADDGVSETPVNVKPTLTVTRPTCGNSKRST